ncbi:MAG TPA: molybdopterin cofactor-binding domain-containing protein [Micromonosporaceae bacterium]
MAELPDSLAANPRLGDWLRVRPDGTVEVRSGKVELGQGVLTALAQIAAEEFDVSVDRIRMVAATTGLSPNEGYTAGSYSIQQSGAAIRAAAAEARAIYLEAAATHLGVRATELTVADGTVTAPGNRSVTYWDLADDALLDRAATGAPSKAAADYRIVGTSTARVDLPNKRYAHDVAADLYGRIVRPPSRGAVLIDVDTHRTDNLPGVVRVVSDGSFLGVIATREEVAIRAAERLRADGKWHEEPTLPDEDDLPGFLTSAPAETTIAASFGPADPPPRQHSATFHRPYVAHASMGPSSATAVAHPDGRLEIWTHSQGVYWIRQSVAHLLDLPEERIEVHHAEGPGCYGHNGADDVALDAVLLALAAPGRPVKVVWSRPDEFTWEPFGPAAVVRLSADLDEPGNVARWQHEIWGNGHVTRPSAAQPWAMLGASHRDGGRAIDPAAEPPLAGGGGATRNAVPGYAFPSYRVINHRLTVMPLRTSALRALGAFTNVFAIESFLDELAESAGRDSVEYRLDQLTDPRGRAVIEAAVRRSGWYAHEPQDSVGLGLGYARYKNSSAYCAVVAEVEAIDTVRVRRLTIAVDAGLIVNPDGTVNQIEGGAVQATSWALKERVRFDRCQVTSTTWETYPILRFSEVPAVDVELLPDGGHPSVGVGEAAQAPTVAAIANGLYAALGVRVRTLPFTDDRVAAAISSSPA